MKIQIILLLVLISCVHSCGWLAFKCKAEEVLDNAISTMIKEAVPAFEQAMDHLFDNDIDPMIDKAEAAVEAAVKAVGDEVKDIADHITQNIKDIIDEAAKTATALVDDVEKAVEKIIADGSTAVQKAQDTLFTDANALLAEVNAIVQKGQCMEAGGAKQIQDAIYKLIKGLNPMYRFSSCWRGLGYTIWRSLEDLTDMELYNYQKTCTLLNKITPTTPIHGPNGITEVYAQGQLYAAEYYCIGETAGSPAFQDVFTQEWVWWGVQYNSWKKLMVVPENRKLTVSADSDCGTPVECFAQAIKRLNEAEAKIVPLQTSVVQLNQTVTPLNDAVNKNTADISSNNNAISDNADAIRSNKDAISDNADAIRSNNSAISSVGNRVSGLTSYACNCTHQSNQNSACDSGFTMGFQYLCKNSSCADAWSPVMDQQNSDSGGMICCDICMGTNDEARAYLDAQPPHVTKLCKSLEKQELKKKFSLFGIKQDY